MSLVSVSRNLWIPAHNWPGLMSSNALGALAQFTLDAANDKCAFVFIANADMPFPDRVSFYSGTMTTSGDVKVTIEPVDSNGFPTGTRVTNSNEITVTVNASNTAFTATGLKGTATLTPGTMYAAVITQSTGNTQIRRGYSTSVGTGIPFAAQKDVAGAWAKANPGETGTLFGFADDAGNYFLVMGLAGACVVSTQTFSNATNPDERGNLWVFPNRVGVIGALVLSSWGVTPGATDDFSVRLYTDPLGTPSQRAIDTLTDGAAQLGFFPHYMFFDTRVVIEPNQVFCLAVKADDTDSASLIRNAYPSSAHLGAAFGTNCYAVTRNDLTGAFASESSGANVYAVMPIIDQVERCYGAAEYALGV